MTADKIVRIGGATAFRADSVMAVPQLLAAGVDYLVFDNLAEGSIGAFGQMAARDPAGGREAIHERARRDNQMAGSVVALPNIPDHFSHDRSIHVRTVHRVHQGAGDKDPARQPDLWGRFSDYRRRSRGRTRGDIERHRGLDRRRRRLRLFFFLQCRSLGLRLPFNHRLHGDHGPVFNHLFLLGPIGRHAGDRPSGTDCQPRQSAGELSGGGPFRGRPGAR